MKNRKTNDLGTFDSLAHAWLCLPHGGNRGDFIHIGNDIYIWDGHQHNWLLDSWTTTDSYHLLHQTGDLHLMGDLRVGGHVISQQRAVFKDDVVVEGRLLCHHLQGHDRGFFTTEERLHEAVPKPKVGDWALVGVSASPQMWHCTRHGTWEMVGDVELEDAFDLDRYDEARAIIDDIVAQGYVFAGVADTTTQPHCPSGYRVFYISSQPGRYVHFDDIEVKGCSVLMWNPVNDDPNRGMWTAKGIEGIFLVNTENLADGAVTLEKTTGLTEYVDTKMRTAIKSISVNGGAVHTPNILGHVNLVVGGGSGGEDDPGLSGQVEQNTRDIERLGSDVEDLGTDVGELDMRVGTVERDLPDLKAGLRQTVVMLNWVQAATPVIIGDEAGIMSRFPRGLYWLNTQTGKIYESRKMTGGQRQWVEVTSEEALYVDAINKVLYVQVLNGTYTYSLVQIPAAGGGGGGTDGGTDGDGDGGEGGEGGGDVTPEPEDPQLFDYTKGNFGAYAKGIFAKAPEDVTEEDVRNSLSLGGLHPNAAVGLGINSATPHIWTEEEMNALGATLSPALSLVEYDGDTASTYSNATGGSNASLLRAVLSHEVNGVKTCIGMKLTKMYYVYVNCSSSAAYPDSYRTNAINLPHDFVIDGEVEGAATGGFAVKCALFYTEHSLNLRNVRLLRRHADSVRTIYIRTSMTDAIRQIQVTGCDFGSAAGVAGGYYIYMRCYSGSTCQPYEDSREGLGENMRRVLDSNCIDHMMISDNIFRGSKNIESADLRVMRSFRVVGNTFLDIERAGMYFATVNSSTSYGQTNCYLSCPMFVAGNTFKGKGTVFKNRTWNDRDSVYCCGALIETSVVYMLHNDIRDMISGVSLVVDPTQQYAGSETDHMFFSHAETYDAYMNCVQVYYANNTVRNIAKFDYSRLDPSDVRGATTLRHVWNGELKPLGWLTHVNSGIFKAKSTNTNYVKGGLPKRDLVRYFKHNDYAIDCAYLKSVWAAWYDSNKPADGASPDDDWDGDRYFYEKMHDKVVNDVLTGDDASEAAKILTLLINSTTLTKNSKIERDGVTYYFRFKEVNFSNNVVNAGEGGIVGDSAGQVPVTHFTMRGNTFVSRYITGGDWRNSDGWMMRPDGNSSYANREALFNTYLFRATGADESIDYTTVDVRDNVFDGMGAVSICPLLNRFDAASPAGTVSLKFGDYLTWRDNIIPTGASFRYLYKNLGADDYPTRSLTEEQIAAYENYVPPTEPQEMAEPEEYD